MPLSHLDYGRLAAENLEEPVWRSGLVQPPVPEFEEMQKAVEEIHVYKGSPVLKLTWLPDHKVIRCGIQQPAYILWIEDIDTHKIEAVPLPRFGFLQLIPRDAELSPGWTLEDEWNRERADWKATYGEEYLHELPPEGLYKGFPGFDVLAVHTKYVDGPYSGQTCCYKTLSERQTTCYGEIYLPTWKLVAHIERGWERFKHEPVKRHGTQAADYQEKSKVTRAGNRANDASKKGKFDTMRENFKQEMASSRWRGLIDVGAAMIKGSKKTP